MREPEATRTRIRRLVRGTRRQNKIRRTVLCELCSTRLTLPINRRIILSGCRPHILHLSMRPGATAQTVSQSRRRLNPQVITSCVSPLRANELELTIASANSKKAFDRKTFELTTTVQPSRRNRLGSVFAVRCPLLFAANPGHFP
jgi:hypothetical protein